jgi:type II secretory ATPase GspE/PulE/Tfp pilus assembly ATPase PilB-like protein
MSETPAAPSPTLPATANHWLVRAAAARHAPLTPLDGFEPASDSFELWRQVAAKFGIDTTALAAAVADSIGLALADPATIQLDTSTLLPETSARKLGVLPLRVEGETLVVAVSDPASTAELEQQVRFSSGKSVRFEILPPEEIDTYLLGVYAMQADRQQRRTGLLDVSGAGLSDNAAENSQTGRLMKVIFRNAIDKRASDVHIQPFAGGGVVRFRIDGVLQRIATLPQLWLKNLARFVKVHGDMDPTRDMIAQDGRLKLVCGNQEFDVRLSVLPAHGGERIVARLLDQGRIFSLKQSNFSVRDRQILERLGRYSAGMILLTGPTGSGKTSTLYSLLSDINRIDINIMTIEEPVEYLLPGVSQIDVDAKQGLTFASALRSILRQDPDVVLVGEIRDGETAGIAVQAAMTGHLVFSTLHTNDALTTVPRLLNLGVDSAVLADSLLGAVAQRLIRRLCPDCRQPVADPLTAAEAEFLRLTGERPTSRAVGCGKCNYTGYRGRIPVVEIVEMTAVMRASLLEGVTDLPSLEKALGNRFRPMASSAAEWVLAGESTPEEAFRALGLRFWNQLAVAHGKSVASVQIDSAGKQGGSTFSSILFLTADATLASAFAECGHEVGRYTAKHCADPGQAKALLEQDQGILAMVADSRLASGRPLTEWIPELRRDLAWSGLPVIFLLPDDAQPGAEILHAYGARMVIGDPVDVDRVRVEVDRALRGDEGGTPIS